MTTPPAGPTPDPSEPSRRRLPWRSATAGWIATAALLAAGVPLFLRMPLWCDVTLYELAARAVLTGGVHYRDVFDTNPPGFVWLMCAVLGVFGYAPEAPRTVDLLIVVSITVLLLRWARAAGATRAGIAWGAAGVASFYPFISEFCHVQRDVWMTLPAVLAVVYRMRRIERARAEPVTDGRVFLTGFLEGVLWSLGFWIKPHVAVPAAVVWFALAARFAGSSDRPLRRLAADLGGVLTAVAVVVGAGLAWMVWTGTWHYYVEVNRDWNTGYLRIIFEELWGRIGYQGMYFPPWSALFYVAAPVAVLNLIDARVWSRSGTADGPGPVGRRLPWWLYADAADDRTRFARAGLAALYLGWSLTMMVFQRNFHYAHVPETLMMIAVFAANRWAAAFLAMALQAAVTLYIVANQGDPAWAERHKLRQKECPVYWYLIDRHPVADAERMRYWCACFAREVSPELRRDVGFQTQHFGGIDPVQLGEVERFLRSQGVGEGDVICWHNTTHPLYMSLGVKPTIRFMHLSTVMEMGYWQYWQIRGELFKVTPKARFVVSDMYRITTKHGRLTGADIDPATGYARVLPAWQLEQFPFNQPLLYRSSNGRYLVHAIRHPAEEWECKIPGGLDDPEPW
jgi:hypothetical protein